MWTKLLVIIILSSAILWIGNTYFTPFFQAAQEGVDHQAYQTKNLLNGIDVKPEQGENLSR